MNRRPRGGNALHEAAAAGHAHVVRMLLEAGVCPCVQNAVGLTPMDLAMEARHGSALQLLCHAAPWCGQLQVNDACEACIEWHVFRAEVGSETLHAQQQPRNCVPWMRKFVQQQTFYL